MRNKKIVTYYNRKQVCFDSISKKSFSKSPLKPYLLMKHIKNSDFENMLEIKSDFKPFYKEDFYIAHTRRYVDNFFRGKGNYNSNGLPWSENLVESVTYTNSSLYHAIKHACNNPEDVTFAPVSGMHHARPTEGSGFCTFSGQVISSVKLYNEQGLVGAYFDLDGHYGNSIEDSRSFVKNLNNAIPEDCNINPKGKNADYNNNFNESLTKIGYQILRGHIHYVVFAHGADSHINDDLGGNCDTKHWLKNAELFAHWVNEVSTFMGKPLPVTLALFGGYRKDNYEAVLNLHTKSLIKISNIICRNNYVDNLIVE
jgi:acetoin utilization deacetylase AcuC-like enzyme